MIFVSACSMVVEEGGLHLYIVSCTKFKRSTLHFSPIANHINSMFVDVYKLCVACLVYLTKRTTEHTHTRSIGKTTTILATKTRFILYVIHTTKMRLSNIKCDSIFDRLIFTHFALWPQTFVVANCQGKLCESGWIINRLIKCMWLMQTDWKHKCEWYVDGNTRKSKCIEATSAESLKHKFASNNLQMS